MAQTNSATWRIAIPYNVWNLDHVARFFVKSTGEVSSGEIQLIKRDGSPQGWKECLARLLLAFKATNNPDHATMGTPRLEEKVGNQWVVVDSDTGVAFTNTVASQQMSQVTLAYYDNEYHPVHFVVVECSVVLPFHSKTAFPNTGWNAWAAAFTSGGDGNDPFQWCVSRSVNYLAAAGLVGVTGTFNRKLRRRRGFA